MWKKIIGINNGSKGADSYHYLTPQGCIVKLRFPDPWISCSKVVNKMELAVCSCTLTLNYYNADEYFYFLLKHTMRNLRIDTKCYDTPLQPFLPYWNA